MERSRYLEVNHGENLFAPLEEESSADVEMEMGKALRFRLGRK